MKKTYYIAIKKVVTEKGSRVQELTVYSNKKSSYRERQQGERVNSTCDGKALVEKRSFDKPHW